MIAGEVRAKRLEMGRVLRRNEKTLLIVEMRTRNDGLLYVSIVLIE